MMNRNIKLLILSLLIIAPLAIFANEIPPNIKKGFSTGDASLISSYFNNTIELNIGGKEEIYSKTQAEIILKDFFKNHKPSSFETIHKGGQGASFYSIGSLKTESGNYRVTLLIKTSNNNTYIHQLRIEKDGV